jgi:hypothetical protein
LQCNQTAYLEFFQEPAVVETQFPKFRWGEVSEMNAGHTKNEWGATKPDPKKIIAYTVVWDRAA